MKKRLVLFFLISLLISCTQSSIVDKNIQPFNDSTQVTNPPLLYPKDIPSPTSTPIETIPHMSQEEAEEFVSELFKDNNSCQYPCFWGFEPGETRWSEAKIFLQPFAIEIEYGGKEKTTKYLEYIVWVPVPDSISELGKEVIFFYISGEDTDHMIELIIPPQRDSDTIETVMKNFGEPEEIWFYSSGLTIGDPTNTLILFYPDQGVQFTYYNETVVYAKNKNSPAYVKICEDDLIGLKSIVKLFSLDAYNNFFEVNSEELSIPFTTINYQQLDSVTNTTIEEFYQSLIQQKDFCFQSDVKFWNP